MLALTSLQHPDDLKHAVCHMIDNLKLNRASLLELVKRNSEVEHGLVVVPLELAYHMEGLDLVCSVLLEELLKGLLLVLALRVRDSARAEADELERLEDNVASAIRVDARDLHLAVVVLHSQLQAVEASEVWDRVTKLSHGHLHDLVDRLMDDKIGVLVDRCLLQIHDDDLPACRLRHHRHLVRW